MQLQRSQYDRTLRALRMQEMVRPLVVRNLEEYRLQGRGGIGVKAAKIDENSRGSLVSALVLFDSDEILAITSAGTVMRTPAAEVRQTGRDSMGVRLVNLDIGTTLLSVTRNSEDEISEQK